MALYADLILPPLREPVQAKEHEIYDTAPFFQCRLFAANGYTLNADVIEKRFKQQS